MIGRTGQDGHAAIQLFGQHGPRQGVGPGLGSEGQGLVRRLAHARVQAVGPADGEDQAPFAPVAQDRQMLGEGAAGEGATPLIAGDQMGAGRGGQDQIGLRRLARLFGFKIGQDQRPQAQGLARQGGAPGIVVGQGRLGPAAGPTDGDDLQPHGAVASGAAVDAVAGRPA